jgi:hypothetical protein
MTLKNKITLAAALLFGLTVTASAQTPALDKTNETAAAADKKVEEKTEAADDEAGAEELDMPEDLEDAEFDEEGLEEVIEDEGLDEPAQAGE